MQKLFSHAEGAPRGDSWELFSIAAREAAVRTLVEELFSIAVWKAAVLNTLGHLGEVLEVSWKTLERVV